MARQGSKGEYRFIGRALSVVILTLNEEDALPRCLEAIPSSIDVFVVDSGSSDNTVNLARGYGCTVLYHEWLGFAGQRNYALSSDLITTDWVLFIDADEIYQKDFWDWAEHTFENDQPQFDVVMIGSRLVLDGKTLNHAPGYPLYHPRLVRRKPNIFLRGNAGHNETIKAGLRIHYLDIPYLHYWHDGPLEAWLTKHIHLARMEVEALVNQSEPHARGEAAHSTLRAQMNSIGAPSGLRVLGRFFFHYFLRGGFRDGHKGLKFSLMYAWFELTKWLLRI